MVAKVLTVLLVCRWASDPCESIRQRLTKFFKDVHESIVYCLKAAVNARELSASTDIREVARFLCS
jgi:TetR/AcrR family transcriptional regulator, transcriptional repressor for nem operon